MATNFLNRESQELSGFSTPRLGRVSDARECAEIVSKWIDNTAWMPRKHSIDELIKIMEEGIPIREFWVLGNPIEGYLSFNKELLQVMGLYVASPGEGKGKLLLGKVKEGRHFIQLWSHMANNNAHRFYCREGFKKIEFIRKGQDGIPEIRFEWKTND